MIIALNAAPKEFEKRLKQLLEKEMLKKLEDLERRIAKMPRTQIEVYEATKGIDNNCHKKLAVTQLHGYRALSPFFAVVYGKRLPGTSILRKLLSLNDLWRDMPPTT